MGLFSAIQLPHSLIIAGFAELVRRFLPLVEVANGAFERLGRYEAALWRQVANSIYTRATAVALGGNERLETHRMSYSARFHVSNRPAHVSNLALDPMQSS